MTLEDLVKKSRKQYVFFLKYTLPKVDDYPNNLLELLDSSRDRWVRLKKLLNK